MIVFPVRAARRRLRSSRGLADRIRKESEFSSPERVKLPLYEYRCEKCGYKYEKIQKFGAEPELVCPKCGGTLERPLTAPALQFKGAGWYVNDYAPKSASGSADKPAGEGAAAPAGDAKPATDSKSAKESKPAAESKPAEAAPKSTASSSSTSTT
jgi:putative FmdB family regulatory protein